MAKKMTVKSVLKLNKRPKTGKGKKPAKQVKPAAGTTPKLVFGSPEWRAKYGKKKAGK